MNKCAVLGAGSWGTALAVLLARNGNEVTLWGRDDEELADIASKRRNDRDLPAIEIPNGRWRNYFTGEKSDGGLAPVAKLLTRFPVALLLREEAI